MDSPFAWVLIAALAIAGLAALDLTWRHAVPPRAALVFGVPLVLLLTGLVWSLTRLRRELDRLRRRRARFAAAVDILRQSDELLEECPGCRRKQAGGLPVCGCGENLVSARERDLTRFWRRWASPDGRERRELLDEPFSRIAARLVGDAGPIQCRPPRSLSRPGA